MSGAPETDETADLFKPHDQINSTSAHAEKCIFMTGIRKVTVRQGPLAHQHQDV